MVTQKKSAADHDPKYALRPSEKDIRGVKCLREMGNVSPKTRLKSWYWGDKYRKFPFLFTKNKKC